MSGSAAWIAEVVGSTRVNDDGTERQLVAALCDEGDELALLVIRNWQPMPIVVVLTLAGEQVGELDALTAGEVAGASRQGDLRCWPARVAHVFHDPTMQRYRMYVTIEHRPRDEDHAGALRKAVQRYLRDAVHDEALAERLALRLVRMEEAEEVRRQK